METEQENEMEIMNEEEYTEVVRKKGRENTLKKFLNKIQLNSTNLQNETLPSETGTKYCRITPQQPQLKTQNP